MLSELYHAVDANEDINFIRMLIESSQSHDALNQVEPNGTTALHKACRRKREDIVMLFIYQFQLNYHWRDKDNRTAYDISCEEIRSLFPHNTRNENPYCTTANVTNPLMIPGLENIDHSTHWLSHPYQAEISTEMFHRAVQSHGDGWKGLFKAIASLFGFDDRNEKLDRWVAVVRDYVNKSISNSVHRKIADQLLKSYRRNQKIEDLFTIYSLSQSFTEYIGQSPERTKYFFAPIDVSSYEVEYRCYQGVSYRGLTMNDAALNQYRIALNQAQRFVRTKTFCSSSTESDVAVEFSGMGELPSGLNSVVMTFNFEEACSSAIKLFGDGPNIPRISHYSDEQEVLILPGVNFRVTLIDDVSKPGVTFITLDHYNTDEEENEAHQERFKSYIDSILLE